MVKPFSIFFHWHIFPVIRCANGFTLQRGFYYITKCNYVASTKGENMTAQEQVDEANKTSSRITKETMTLHHIANNGSYLARSMTFEEKEKLISTANFILEKAKMMELDLSKINWKHFANEEKTNLIDSIPEILTKLIEINNNPENFLDNVTVFYDERIEQLRNAFIQSYNPQVFIHLQQKSLKNQIVANEKFIADLSSEIDIASKSIANMLLTISDYRKKNEINNILLANPTSEIDESKFNSPNCAWELIYSKIEGKETDKLVYISKRECFIHHNNPALNVNKTLNMGMFLLIIYPNLSRNISQELKNFFRIIPVGNNKQAVNTIYFHPHVTESGTVCMGNATERLMERFTAQDYVSFSNLLWNLLEIYNPESPYRPLDKFTLQMNACTLKVFIRNNFREYFISGQLAEFLDFLKDYDLEHRTEKHLGGALLLVNEDIASTCTLVTISKGTIFSFRCLNSDTFKIRNKSTYSFPLEDLSKCSFVSSFTNFAKDYYVVPTAHLLEEYLEEKKIYEIYGTNLFDNNDFGNGVSFRLLANDNTMAFNLNTQDFRIIKKDSEELKQLMNEGYTVAQ